MIIRDIYSCEEQSSQLKGKHKDVFSRLFSHNAALKNFNKRQNRTPENKMFLRVR